MCWSQMVGFILETFRKHIRRLWLYQAIRNVQYGISHYSFHLFIMLEIYNPETGTFFMPVRELGFALHKIHEISALSLGEVSYEDMS